MSLSGTCEEHDWSWDPSDDYGCPVCYGINIERERIIALLETINIHCIDCMAEQLDEMGVPKVGLTMDRLIALIKGENE